MKKLTAEFCISSTLHHVNVVETVDLVQDENQHWCEVMEFCPGGDLYAAIKKGRMSPSEIECCFSQILQGLSYLHSQGVAHRDMKPENIFFNGKGQLKVSCASSLETFVRSFRVDRRFWRIDCISPALGGNGAHVFRLMRKRAVYCS